MKGYVYIDFTRELVEYCDSRGEGEKESGINRKRISVYIIWTDVARNY